MAANGKTEPSTRWVWWALAAVVVLLLLRVALAISVDLEDQRREAQAMSDVLGRVSAPLLTPEDSLFVLEPSFLCIFNERSDLDGGLGCPYAKAWFAAPAGAAERADAVAKVAEELGLTDVAAAACMGEPCSGVSGYLSSAPTVLAVVVAHQFPLNAERADELPKLRVSLAVPYS